MSETQREFQDGEHIAGTSYRVVRLIGTGGMGCVYEVEHVELGKRFVLKSLLRELARRRDLVARLRNEWRALAKLENENIVSVTDAGTSASGVPFYVMERLDGEPLSQRLRSGPLPLAEVFQVGAAIVDGLAAAHRIGIVHRDVKPPNIFLLSNGATKLLDFGIAKVTDSAAEVITARGVAIGTPRYMSPEQARGETVDARSDLYAVGLVLFEMAAGVGPFDDCPDANEVFLSQLTRVPAQVSSFVGGVPSAFDDIVTALLQKDADMRPRDARVVASQLRQLAASAPPGSAELPLTVSGTQMMLPSHSEATGPAPQTHTAPLGEGEATVHETGPTLLAGGGALAEAGALERRSTVPLDHLPSQPPVPTHTVRVDDYRRESAPGADRTQRLDELGYAPPTEADVPETRTAVPVPHSEELQETPPPVAGGRAPARKRSGLLMAASACAILAVGGLVVAAVIARGSDEADGTAGVTPAASEAPAAATDEPVADKPRTEPVASASPEPSTAPSAAPETAAAAPASASKPPGPVAQVAKTVPRARRKPSKVRKKKAPSSVKKPPEPELPASGL